MGLLTIIGLLVVGFGVGVSSGLLGIGGGVLVIPALVMGFGFTQQRAVGTSLAMLLPPIGVFAVLRYARGGQVDWAAAMILAAAFAGGAFVGAFAVSRGWVSERALRTVFAVFLLYVAGNMLFRGEKRVWTVLLTLGLGAAYGLAYLGLRAVGRKWERETKLSAIYAKQIEAPVPMEYEI
jgi:uncharacterized membrane protein YfcA